MKTRTCGTRFLVSLLLTLVFGARASAQMPAKQNLPGQLSGDVPPPNPKGTNPKPEDATTAILTAFDKYEVVGMSAAHGKKDLDDFILGLIRVPTFPTKVNDIVVECGNSMYQPILDRYIEGENVPPSDVRQVWRNTTQPMCGVSAFYEELFPLVRRTNQSLAPGKKLRVLAGDPPIDWSKVRTGRDFGHGQFLMERDATIASVMQKEVLAKHRKALMLFGTAHLFHAESTAVRIYEKDYPGMTLVIADHVGFGNWTPLAKYNDDFEARMASWPVPALVQQMKGTWLLDLLDSTYSSGNVTFGVTDGGKLPAGPAIAKGTFAEVPPEAEHKFSEMVDAYLYLGPRDLLLNEPTPAEIFLDKDYMAELQRRTAIMGGGPVTDEANPERVSERDSNPFFYDPNELDKLMQPSGGNSRL
jgi:hypothetical protein